MSSDVAIARPNTLVLSEPKVERRVHFSHKTTVESTPIRRKSRSDPEFRPWRKRSHSYSGPGDNRSYQKRRMSMHMVLPSKFLLGGNISDPLNLGSLGNGDNEDVPTPMLEKPVLPRHQELVRVIIPKNINDPLNLDAGSDNEESATDDGVRLKNKRKRQRQQRRKRRLSEPTEILESKLDSSLLDLEPNFRADRTDLKLDLEKVMEVSKVAEDSTVVDMNRIPLTINTNLEPDVSLVTLRDSADPRTPTGPKTPTGQRGIGIFKRQQKCHRTEDKIVSPVIPQPGQRHPSKLPRVGPLLGGVGVMQPPQRCNVKKATFPFGNYTKYYGYRNRDNMDDPRLRYLNPEWFNGKEVLDLGCNIGHISLTVARDFNPKRVVGVDIDKKLVYIANKNIRHYLKKGGTEEMEFPKSMKLLYGPLRPPLREDGTLTFPHNVKFVQGNYVLESDVLLETVRAEFDIILCLSVTKWIHLNWGDGGLKRFFRRTYANLRPGGMMVLEPQAWPSYNKRKKLTPEIFANYKNIRFFPDQFVDFLLHDVGFTKSEQLATPLHVAKGFQRPIFVFTKVGEKGMISSTKVVHEAPKCDATAAIIAAESDAIPEETHFQLPLEVLPCADMKNKMESVENVMKCDFKMSENIEGVFQNVNTEKVSTVDTSVSQLNAFDGPLSPSISSIGDQTNCEHSRKRPSTDGTRLNSDEVPIKMSKIV